MEMTPAIVRDPTPEPPSGVQFASLTLVLPAYDEAARIGPALDELFGWLAGAAARVADPEFPPRVRVLVVDDGSIDATAHLVLDRPEAALPEDAPIRLELLRVAHGGKSWLTRWCSTSIGGGDVWTRRLGLNLGGPFRASLMALRSRRSSAPRSRNHAVDHTR